jgi:hypothetical protein
MTRQTSLRPFPRLFCHRYRLSNVGGIACNFRKGKSLYGAKDQVGEAGNLLLMHFVAFPAGLLELLLL